jgi:hypothetical protein
MPAITLVPRRTGVPYNATTIHSSDLKLQKSGLQTSKGSSQHLTTAPNLNFDCTFDTARRLPSLITETARCELHLFSEPFQSVMRPRIRPAYHCLSVFRKNKIRPPKKMYAAKTRSQTDNSFSAYSQRILGDIHISSGTIFLCHQDNKLQQC